MLSKYPLTPYPVSGTGRHESGEVRRHLRRSDLGFHCFRSALGRAQTKGAGTTEGVGYVEDSREEPLGHYLGF
jgi:hypothetical protein